MISIDFLTREVARHVLFGLEDRPLRVVRLRDDRSVWRIFKVTVRDSASDRVMMDRAKRAGRQLAKLVKRNEVTRVLRMKADRRDESAVVASHAGSRHTGLGISLSGIRSYRIAEDRSIVLFEMIGA